MKRKIVIGAVLAAVVIALGAVFLPRLFRSPAEEFLACQQEAFVKPLLSFWTEELSVYDAEKLSTDVTVALLSDDREMARYLDGTFVELRVEKNKDSLLVNGEVVLMDTPLLSGALTSEGDRVGFWLPDLDENYYVMDLSRRSEVQVDPDGVEISPKEWLSLAQTYVDLVSTMFNNDNVVRENQTIVLERLGIACKGKAYTFTPTAADVENTINKLADYLENDEELRSLFFRMVSGNPMAAVSAGYTGEDPQAEFEARLAELVARLRESAAEAGRAVEESGFTWQVYTEGRELRMVRLGTNEGTLVCERTGNSTDGTQVLYSIVDGERELLLRYDYGKEGKVYRGEVTVNSQDSSIEFSYDMDTGHRSVLGIPNGSYSIHVSASEGDSLVVMEVAGDGADGTDMVLNGRYGTDSDELATVQIHATAKGSAQKPAQAPVDITDYSEEELAALVEDMSSRAYSHMFRQLMPLLLGF